MFFFNLCLASFWQKQRGILTIIFCPSGGLTITHSLEFNCHCVCEEKKTWSPLLGLEQCRMNSHRRSRLVEIIIWGFTFLRNWLEVTGWMHVARFLSKIHELDDMTLGNRPFIFIDEIWGPLLESKMSGWRSWSCNSTGFQCFCGEKTVDDMGVCAHSKTIKSRPRAHTRLELPLDGFCRWTDLFLQTGRYALQMNVVLCSKHVGPRGGRWA